jgi:hypothetical protein
MKSTTIEASGYLTSWNVDVWSVWQLLVLRLCDWRASLARAVGEGDWGVGVEAVAVAVTAQQARCSRRKEVERANYVGVRQCALAVSSFCRPHARLFPGIKTPA